MCARNPALCILANMLSLGFSTASPALVFSPCHALVVVEFRLDLARPISAFPIAKNQLKSREIKKMCFRVRIAGKGNVDLEIISITIFPSVLAHTKRLSPIGALGDNQEGHSQGACYLD